MLYLLIDRVEVLRPTRHKVDHFGDVLLSQSPGLILNAVSKGKTDQLMTTFYPRGAILAGLLAVIVYPSICLVVCLSVRLAQTGTVPKRLM